jgi:hypothetical protein
MNLTKKFVIKKRILLEIFLIFNLFFLTFDILIAHAVNSFQHEAEFVPLIFSFVGSIILAILFLYKNRWPGVSKNANILIGSISVFVGVLGLYFHLESSFLIDPNLKNLVYTAPVVAPLSYAGIGVLLIVNAVFSSKDVVWIKTTLVCGYLGLLGNFILSVCDHAQNDFFHLTEWIPVIASAAALALFAPLPMGKPNRGLVLCCEVVLLVQVLVGVIGFVFHLFANLASTGGKPVEAFVFGAPIFAPLLFINLAILLIFPLNSLAKAVK